MGFQESSDIACLFRKTHGFDKKDRVEVKAISGILLKKKGKREKRKGEKKGK